MFVVNNALTFTVNFKARSDASSSVKYLLIKPDKQVSSYTPFAVTDWSSATDGTATLAAITPDQTGLYKMMFYLDSGGTLGALDTLLGEYYFNVVANSTTSSFTIG